MLQKDGVDPEVATIVNRHQLRNTDSLLRLVDCSDIAHPFDISYLYARAWLFCNRHADKQKHTVRHSLRLSLGTSGTSNADKRVTYHRDGKVPLCSMITYYGP